MPLTRILADAVRALVYFGAWKLATQSPLALVTPDDAKQGLRFLAQSALEVVEDDLAGLEASDCHSRAPR